jgi:hypothetical protein
MTHNKLATIYSSYHTSFIDKMIVKKRLEMIKVVNEYLEDKSLIDVLDIGTTGDSKNPSSNILIKNLQNFRIYKSISDQKINSNFFNITLQKSITDDFTLDEIKVFSSDLVVSNATIEHVGNYENQKKMIENIIKLSNKFFIIITPNRSHPLEFHTKIPFFHWLPKKIHRKLLSLLSFDALAKEENLNLMSKKEINLILKKFTNITYELKSIKFLLFKSNFIIIGKKTS